MEKQLEALTKQVAALTVHGGGGPRGAAGGAPGSRKPPAADGAGDDAADGDAELAAVRSKADALEEALG
eukprot:5212961-Pyramimonas_sp.AAC.1